jgi:hypothetical protein
MDQARVALFARWGASDVTAKTRKRCPMCSRMVEVGSPAVLRDERRQQTGAGKTPWIGNRQSYTRGAWHLYHPDCFVAFATRCEELAAEAPAEAEKRRAEMVAALGLGQ